MFVDSVYMIGAQVLTRWITSLSFNTQFRKRIFNRLHTKCPQVEVFIACNSAYPSLPSAMLVVPKIPHHYQ